MERRTWEHLLQLNTRIANGETLSDALRAELSATVQALRQQRASTLATSEAKLRKINRPVRDPKPDSFAPVDLIIDTYKVRISDNQAGDELAERLEACWNFCLGIPMKQLTPMGAQSFMPDP